MNKIENSFNALKEKGEMGVIPYLTIGFPSIEDTMEMVPALADGGADIIELGVPYSDPLADGTTIQKASFKALSNGVTLKKCLDICKKLRLNGITTPLVLMGYYNPILKFGLKEFAAACLESGVDGIIVPDLPFEESQPLKNECQKNKINLIPLLAPTSTDKRIEKTCENADGFIYCVSLTGVTGARQEMQSSVPAFIERVKKYAKVPIAIGFGISQRQHVESLAKIANAAVVGSALIDTIEKTPAAKRKETVKQFISELKGNSKVWGTK
jgi:tryptophan synthase alpha chain